MSRDRYCAICDHDLCQCATIEEAEMDSDRPSGKVIELRQPRIELTEGAIPFVEDVLQRLREGKIRAITIVLEKDDGTTGSFTGQWAGSWPAKMIGELEIQKARMMGRECARRAGLTDD